MTDTQFSPWVREADLAAWNRFAAVNDEFIDIHMDPEAGRRAGFSHAFGMGNLTWSYFHAALEDWFGPGMEIAYLSSRFTSPVLHGTQVLVVCTELADGEGSGDSAVTMEARGDDDVVHATASAVVRVPRAGLAQ